MIRAAGRYVPFLIALSALARPVSAAQLSMRFAGGASEVTLAIGATAVIEIVWTMAPQVKTARNLGALNNRFDVTGVAGIEVSATSTPLTGWETSGSDGVGGPLSGFFASADGAGNPIVETTALFESVVQTIQVVNVDGASGSVQVAFRAGEPLPDAITSTGGQWALVGTAPGTQEFDIGQGSPGYTDLNGAANTAAPLVIRFAGGGGGGGGGDPVDNANDNEAPPPANDNTPDDGMANDNQVVVDPTNDNADKPENDNVAPPDDENLNENVSTNGDEDDDPPPDNVADNENASNDNRPRPTGGGGGGGGGACGLGMICAVGWTFAGLTLIRRGRRRSFRRP